MGFTKWMLGFDIPTKRELQDTMPSRQRSQHSARSTCPRSYQEDYGYGEYDAPPPPLSRPRQRTGVVRLSDGRTAITRYTPSFDRQSDRDVHRPGHQDNMLASDYYDQPFRQSRHRSQLPQRDSLNHCGYGSQNFPPQADRSGRRRTFHDLSSSRPARSRYESPKAPNYEYEYDYDPAFARALSNADRAGPPKVDFPRPTRLIQNPNQSYNIHLHSEDPQALRHHKLMVRNYGLECAICIQLDREQFGYVPRPSGYMEVGVDDPFCFHCGLKHTALTGDDVGHGNFGRRTGRMRRYDEDGEEDEGDVRGGAGARIMKMTEHVAGAAAAEEEAEEAVAEASGGLASTGDAVGANWAGFGNAAKGVKGRKKDNL